MRVLVEQAVARGIELRCGVRITEVRAPERELWLEGGERISYGHVVNAAGLHADTIAHRFGVGHRYTLLPFKGLYWKLDSRAGFDIRHLLYPVPDLRVPFLGVHSTTTIDGQTYLGPTAVPAFGRENYRGLEGTSACELARIGGRVCRQLVSGNDGFRALAWQEGRRFFKPWFLDAARAILPRLRGEHLLPTEKVGIRAQMLDRETGHLVNDFLIERGPASTHVLNAISPAWTCSFPLARLICEEQVFTQPALMSA
jgi:L-2-hydroxyglutarate oxidase LhgO